MNDLQIPPLAGKSKRLSLRVAVVVALIILAGAAAYPWCKVWVQAADILLESNGQTPPAPLRFVLDQHVSAQAVTIRGTDGMITRATLYTPAGRPDAPGMVIIHGLDPGGMESVAGYSRLVASTGLRVLAPDVPALKKYNAAGSNASTLRRVGDSTVWLAHYTRRPVALMGISFGGGLAMAAAARPAYAPSVGLVFDVGGYDDLIRVMNFYITGDYAGPNGLPATQKRSPWGNYLLEFTDLQMFGSPDQRAALAPLLQAEVVNEAHHPKGQREKIAAMTASLSPSQREEWERFLTGQNQARFARLVTALSPTLAEVSPHGHLQDLAAQVYILHGLEDDVIPVGEARWLAHDLPAGHLRMMVLSPLLSHVHLQGEHATWRDKLRLLACMDAVHFDAIQPYSNPRFWLAFTYLAAMLAAAIAIGAALALALERQQSAADAVRVAARGPARFV